jgi:hypothetical protein
VVTPVVYKAEGFCSEKCSDIFAILSKHGCNLITADEAFAALSAYNLDEITLNDNILAHIEKIKSEASVKVEKAVAVEPVVAEKPTSIEEPTVQYNKKNKKKW